MIFCPLQLLDYNFTKKYYLALEMGELDMNFFDCVFLFLHRLIIICFRQLSVLKKIKTLRVSKEFKVYVNFCPDLINYFIFKLARVPLCYLSVNYRKKCILKDFFVILEGQFCCQTLNPCTGTTSLSTIDCDSRRRVFTTDRHTNLLQILTCALLFALAFTTFVTHVLVLAFQSVLFSSAIHYFLMFFSLRVIKTQCVAI